MLLLPIYSGTDTAYSSTSGVLSFDAAAPLCAFKTALQCLHGLLRLHSHLPLSGGLYAGISIAEE